METVSKFLYRCKCGHGFYRGRKRWLAKCGVCGSRRTKFIKKVLKVKRKKIKTPR